MGRRLVTLTGVVVCLVTGFTLSQCFTPSYADCAFRCGPQAPECPDEYECRPDGYCHLPDSEAVCLVLPDLPPPIDAGGVVDGNGNRTD